MSRIERTSAERATHTMKAADCLRWPARLLPAQSWRRLTLRAESAARTAPFARGRDTRTRKAKTRLEGRVCISGEAGEISSWRHRASPKSPNFSKPRLLATGEVRPRSAASGRVALQPRRPFASPLSPSPSTSIPPAVRRRLRWALHASSASPTAPAMPGRPCAHSRKRRRDVARAPVSRHLQSMAEEGVVTSASVCPAVASIDYHAGRALTALRWPGTAACPTSAKPGVPQAGTREEQTRKA